MIKNISLRFIFTFVILIGIILVSESFTNKYVYKRGKPINTVVIPDIIQENIPKIPYLDVISDIFVSFSSFIFIVIFLFNGQYKYIILYFVIFLLMRIVTYIYFISTTLPDSSKSCVYGSNFLTASMNMGSCNNLGISGHFVNTVFQLGLLNRYYGSSYWLLYIIIYVLGFILICASRNHYTIDCLTSSFVALFFIYEINNIQKGLNYIIGKKYFNL
jgi:hypothetical protein